MTIEIAVEDWCPTCTITVTIDWYTDERTGWDCHTACSTALVRRDKYSVEETSDHEL
jgi:hypothetical protein